MGLAGSTFAAAVGGSTRGLASGLGGVVVADADAVGGATVEEASGATGVVELLAATGSLRLG